MVRQLKKDFYRKLLCFYYMMKNCKSFDQTFFKGKRVSIIGGADSALFSKDGEYIDSFDVVVRVNKGVELIESQQEYIGSKTHYLYHSFFDTGDEKFSSPITTNLWVKSNVENIVYCFPLFETDFMRQFISYNKINKVKIPVIYIDKKNI